MYKKIENNPGYLRDVSTSGIISVDNDGLQAYKRQREYAKVQNNTIDEMSKRINSMNLEVQNILNTRYRDYTSLLRYFSDEPGRQAFIRFGTEFGS